MSVVYQVVLHCHIFHVISRFACHDLSFILTSQNYILKSFGWRANVTFLHCHCCQVTDSAMIVGGEIEGLKELLSCFQWRKMYKMKMLTLGKNLIY